MSQMISRKKIEMICEDSKLKPDEVHRKSFTCMHFYTHTLLLYAHKLLYTNAFTDGHTHTHRRTPLRQTHTHMHRRIHTHTALVVSSEVKFKLVRFEVKSTWVRSAMV